MLPLALRWVAERGLALAAPPNEHVVAQRRGWCPATVEPSS
jgi:hypothetical protein